MVERIYKRSTRVRNFFYLFILLTLVWMALTSSFHWQELTAGVLISLILSLFLNNSYAGLGFPPPTVKTLFFLFIYIVALFKEIIKANIDVAYRVVHPKMPIRPGIVVVKTELKQDLAKLMLANSITLTPGTFTLDIAGDKLLIHWINVGTQDSEKATQAIALKFEKHLKRVFS
ncbi:MAG: Na+/H+ antiporter subunit E [Desulfatiglandaceae bacterium]